jgi:hypothetical protein
MQGSAFDRRRPAKDFRWTVLSFLCVATVSIGALGTPVWSETHDDGGGHTDADDSGHSDSGHDGGKGPKGGGNHGSDDTDSGGHSGASGRGSDDHGDDSEGDDHGGGSEGKGRGGQSSQAGQGNQGGQKGGGAGAGAGGSGRPVWAQEGIPEVELGRLNVVRSPTRVLDRALDEALSGFTAREAAFYRLDLDDMVRELSQHWDDVNFIDSPLQNLALFRDAADGRSVLRDVGIVTDNNTLLAVFLGTASDKAIPITADTVTAVSMMLDQPLSPAQAAALAADAERIRRAVLAGHG